MNIFFTKWACQATSITNLTLKHVSWLAPQKASTTYIFLLDNCPVTMFLSSFQTLISMGLLSFLDFSLDHHNLFFVVSSLTIYLSLGDLPV